MRPNHVGNIGRILNTRIDFPFLLTYLHRLQWDGIITASLTTLALYMFFAALRRSFAQPDRSSTTSPRATTLSAAAFAATGSSSAAFRKAAPSADVLLRSSDETSRRSDSSNTSRTARDMKASRTDSTPQPQPGSSPNPFWKAAPSADVALRSGDKISWRSDSSNTSTTACDIKALMTDSAPQLQPGSSPGGSRTIGKIWQCVSHIP